MTELVQLERRHEEFPPRRAAVVAISMDSLDDTRKMQEEFPHLALLSDEAMDLSEAAGLIHRGAAPDGGDADVPTTILVDRNGIVRWIYRSPSVIARLSPDEVLRAIDQHLR